MAEPKTRRNDGDVAAYLASVPDQGRRADAEAVCELMAEITGDPPTLWGASIVGFGSKHYRYASGREGGWPVVGFSPRKQSLTLYLMDGFDQHGALLDQLGKHSLGKSCLSIKRLTDVDVTVLRQLVEA